MKYAALLSFALALVPCAYAKTETLSSQLTHALFLGLTLCTYIINIIVSRRVDEIGLGYPLGVGLYFADHLVDHLDLYLDQVDYTDVEHRTFECQCLHTIPRTLERSTLQFW
ncbi:hypothetical protein B0H19DRAFT_1268027 [Mycena capillaripes]|nr:hypothetical protein B0H19DRAFT_1268027 [Mycena capillaripes]